MKCFKGSEGERSIINVNEVLTHEPTFEDCKRKLAEYYKFRNLEINN